VGLKDLAQGVRTQAELVRRVQRLEADVAELRRHNLRLAELVDVVQELLVPLASRDDEQVAAAIEKFNRSL
jgi:hypothetical protein